MTLNALNPLFQVLAALIIFVVGFFALFISLVTAVVLSRLAYVSAVWASKGVTNYAQRGSGLVLLHSHGNAAILAWRTRLAEMLAAPRFR